MRSAVRTATASGSAGGVGGEGGNVPPSAAAPKRSAALFMSAASSFSLSSLAFSRGSSTASSSYSSLASAALAAFKASFSASFAFSVPFFFGGATGAGAGFSSSSSDEDASQSLWSMAGGVGSEKRWERWSHAGNQANNATRSGGADVRRGHHPPRPRHPTCSSPASSGSARRQRRPWAHRRRTLLHTLTW